MQLRMRIGYGRVSTADQNLDLQADCLVSANVDATYWDKVSGAVRARPGLDAALAQLGRGDTLVVYKLDRLSRSFRDLVDIADMVAAKGAFIHSVSDGINTETQIGMVVLRILSTFADYEREQIRDRTRDGLAARKARGLRLGRKPALDAVRLATANRLIADGMTVDMAAATIGVGRATLFRHRRASVDGVAVFETFRN